MVDGSASEVVKRADEEEKNNLLDPMHGLVDLAHAPSRQDLWDLDDDIFKPLLDRVGTDQKQEHTFSLPPLVADANDALPSSNYHHMERRRPVLTETPRVTMKAQPEMNMPRVIWQPNGSLAKGIESIGKKFEIFFTGVLIFAVWTFALVMAARFASIYLFAFDPVSVETWRMVFNLYNSGSTFQWTFVLFYLAVAIGWPVGGLMLVAKKAENLKAVIAKVFSPITYILTYPRRRRAQAEYQESLRRIVSQGNQAYKGARFKPPATEEAPVGGSIGGTGSGGGHGRPSWQGGPANTQAFPRAEQGRR